MKHKLQQKLFESGLIEAGNSEDIKAFKKAYKTEYDQQFNKEYKAKTKRTKLTFTDEEMAYLKDVATSYTMPLATFLKASIFAYHKGTYIHFDRSTISEIEHFLHEINRRIGESIQYIHVSKNITVTDIQSIKMDLAELEKALTQSLRNPPRLEEWLKNHIEQDELFLPKLLHAIATYLHP